MLHEGLLHGVQLAVAGDALDRGDDHLSRGEVARGRAGVADAADLQPGAVLLNPFPMVNMAGISTSFVSWLLLGGVLVQHHPFDLQIFLQQVREVAFGIA